MNNNDLSIYHINEHNKCDEKLIKYHINHLYMSLVYLIFIELVNHFNYDIWKHK